MVNSRVVTHFGIPHFYLSFLRVCMKFLNVSTHIIFYSKQLFVCTILCLLLLSFPYIFSQFSPRQFTNIEATFLDRIYSVQYSEESDGRIREWKELNVSFVYHDKLYLGFIEYCDYHGSSSDREKVKGRVENCEENTKKEFLDQVLYGDLIDTYHDSNLTIEDDPKLNVLYFKEDITKYFTIEFVFSCILSVFTLILSFVCFCCCTSLSELRGCGRYSYINSKFVPKHKLLDGEIITSSTDQQQEEDSTIEEDPSKLFNVKGSNSYHCGMMDFRRGYLVSPRFTSDDNIGISETTRKTYQLSLRESFFPFLPKNQIISFWGSLALTNRSKDEKEEVIMNIKLPRDRMFSVWFKYVICGPLFCSVFHVITFFLSVPFIYLLFEEFVGMYGYISLWFSALILFSFLDSVISRVGTGLMKVYANELLVTDSRIVICEISEKYYNPTAKNIRYLYYDDIDALELNLEKKRIKIKTIQVFNARSRGVVNNNNFRLEKYTQHLETQEELQMLHSQMLEAKKYFMDSLSAVIEEEEDFDGMDEIPMEIEGNIEKIESVTFGEYDDRHGIQAGDGEQEDHEGFRYPMERSLLEQSDRAQQLREYEEDSHEDSMENVD